MSASKLGLQGLTGLNCPRVLGSQVEGIDGAVHVTASLLVSETSTDAVEFSGGGASEASADRVSVSDGS